MKRKLKPKTKAKKNQEVSLGINGNETASELYTRYIGSQNESIRQLWIKKYKEEKANK